VNSGNDWKFYLAAKILIGVLAAIVIAGWVLIYLTVFCGV
jgi:hypothetical protein